MVNLVNLGSMYPSSTLFPISFWSLLIKAEHQEKGCRYHGVPGEPRDVGNIIVGLGIPPEAVEGLARPLQCSTFLVVLIRVLIPKPYQTQKKATLEGPGRVLEFRV